MAQADEHVIELREKLQEVAGQEVRPDLVDEARRHASAPAPLGNRGQREELIRIVEDCEEELVIALELHSRWSGCRCLREPSGSRSESCELVYAAGELERILVADIDAIRSGDLGDDILELVLDAESYGIGDATHRQEEHVSAGPRDEPRALLMAIRQRLHDPSAAASHRSGRGPAA